MNRLLVKGSRIVEYPFAIGSLDITHPCKLLAFGSFNDMSVAECASLGFDIYCFDLVGRPFVHPNIRFFRGDFLITSAQFASNSFDAALGVSSIEHAGLYPEGESQARDGDRRVVESIFRLLRPGGRLVMTVPFGKTGEYPPAKPSFRKYDVKAISDLLSGFSLYRLATYSSDRENNWRPASPSVLESDDSNSSKSVACIVAIKPS